MVKQAGDVGEQFEFDPSWSDDNFLLYSGGSQTSDPPGGQLQRRGSQPAARLVAGRRELRQPGRAAHAGRPG